MVTFEGIGNAIKDLDTNEYVVNFDNNYTQISADSTGNYFDVYMSGLEPERYYEGICHLSGNQRGRKTRRRG